MGIHNDNKDEVHHGLRLLCNILSHHGTLALCKRLIKDCQAHLVVIQAMQHWAMYKKVQEEGCKCLWLFMVRSPNRSPTNPAHYYCFGKRDIFISGGLETLEAALATHQHSLEDQRWAIAALSFLVGYRSYSGELPEDAILAQIVPLDIEYHVMRAMRVFHSSLPRAGGWLPCLGCLCKETGPPKCLDNNWSSEHNHSNCHCCPYKVPCKC